MINSHDRTRRFQLMAGVFRMICSNGMIIMDNKIANPVKITHVNLRQSIADIVNGARELGKQADRVASNVYDMQNTTMDEPQIQRFGDAAIRLRYRGCLSPLDSVTLTGNVRRPEDLGNTVWRVFNRVQEHLMVGGLFTGHRHTRPMVSLSEQLIVNRGLWHLAASVLDNTFDQVSAEILEKN
jgi:hypothetical protein